MKSQLMLPSKTCHFDNKRPRVLASHGSGRWVSVFPGHRIPPAPNLGPLALDLVTAGPGTTKIDKTKSYEYVLPNAYASKVFLSSDSSLPPEC
jgi:hypothetical protein